MNIKQFRLAVAAGLIGQPNPSSKGRKPQKKTLK